MSQPLKAMIIDDEPLAHDVILTYADNVPFLSIEAQFYSATEALTSLKENAFDVLFLDIQMPVLTGLDLLKVLDKTPQVIITSAYQDYALQGYEFDVTDYLLKPYTFERFLQAVTKVHDKCIEAGKSQTDVEPQQPQTDSVFIKVDKKHILVPFNEIDLLEAYGNYVKVFRGKERLLTAKTLTSFEQSLPDSTFWRVHKSAIVNRHKVVAIEGDTLTMSNGMQQNVGKLYRHRLRQILANDELS